jgi:hypothetical protein
MRGSFGSGSTGFSGSVYKWDQPGLYAWKFGWNVPLAFLFTSAVVRRGAASAGSAVSASSSVYTVSLDLTRPVND